jgi:hypothetical protein
MIIGNGLFVRSNPKAKCYIWGVAGKRPLGCCTWKLIAIGTELEDILCNAVLPGGTT